MAKGKATKNELGTVAKNGGRDGVVHALKAHSTRHRPSARRPKPPKLEVVQDEIDIESAMSGNVIRSAAELLEEWDRLDGMVLIPSGLKRLDGFVGGGFPGSQVAAINGPPGSGKSDMARHIVAAAAAGGHAALFVDRESGARVIALRNLAQRAGLSTEQLTGQAPMSAADERALKKARAEFQALGVDYITDPGNLDDLFAKVKQWVEDNSEPKPPIVIFDSAQRMAQGSTENDQRLRVQAVAYGAEQLAQTTGCAVVLVSEQKRGASKGPGMEASAETRALEYTASLLLRLEPLTDARGTPSLTRRVHMHVDKNRLGPTGKAPFDLEFYAPWSLREVDSTRISGADKVGIDEKIFERIREHGPQSRTQLRKKLGVSTTVAGLRIDALIANGILRRRDGSSKIELAPDSKGPKF